MLQKSAVCIDGAPPGIVPAPSGATSAMSALPGWRDFSNVIASEFCRRASSVPVRVRCGARDQLHAHHRAERVQRPFLVLPGVLRVPEQIVRE